MGITTTITWPAVLPGPLREGHTTKHGTPFVRTQMASGRARQRRAFTSVPSEKRFSWLFTESQCIAFESWFRDVLMDGGEWFSMNARTPLGSDTTLVCRFMGMYDGPELVGGDSWQVNAELEVWARPLLPPGWGAVSEYITGADTIDRAVNQEWPAV